MTQVTPPNDNPPPPEDLGGTPAGTGQHDGLIASLLKRIAEAISARVGASTATVSLSNDLANIFRDVGNFFGKSVEEAQAAPAPAPLAVTGPPVAPPAAVAAAPATPAPVAIAPAAPPPVDPRVPQLIARGYSPEQAAEILATLDDPRGAAAGGAPAAG